jgi:hypothetical protein
MSAGAPQPRTCSRLWTPVEAAQYLGVATQTLAQWRARRVGPAYCKLGVAVRYRESDMLDWLTANTIRTAVGE